MATKKKTIYFCQQCGHESAKWLGQCPACKEWNSFVEEPVKTEVKTKGVSRAQAASRLTERARPVALSAVSADTESRDNTHFKELNRVLGGGLVRGSVTLVGGDPGIGKSTLHNPVTGSPLFIKRRKTRTLYFRRGIPAPDQAARHPHRRDERQSAVPL